MLKAIEGRQNRKIFMSRLQLAGVRKNGLDASMLPANRPASSFHVTCDGSPGNFRWPLVPGEQRGKLGL
jgi:hypothetical protein